MGRRHPPWTADQERVYLFRHFTIDHLGEDGEPTMAERVLVVGNCNPDHAMLSLLLKRSFQADVVRAHSPSDALAALRSGPFGLVLVNRILDRDGSEGLELIRTIKASPEFGATPVMMITDYPEHQALAVAAGAASGFGKSELQDAETHEKLARILGA